jgi:hypothetical protein
MVAGAALMSRVCPLEREHLAGAPAGRCEHQGDVAEVGRARLSATHLGVGFAATLPRDVDACCMELDANDQRGAANLSETDLRPSYIHRKRCPTAIDHRSP